MSERRRIRLSFNARILIPFVATIVLLLGFVLWAIGDRIARQIRVEAEENVRISQRVFENALSLWLQLRSRSLPNEPRFRAVAQLAEPKTIEFLLRELIGEVDVDLLAFVSADRAVAAAASRPPFDGAGLDLASTPFVAEAVAAGAVRAHWQEVGGRVVQLAALPMEVGGRVAGAVVIGEVMDEAGLAPFHQLTGCEVIILAGDRVAASTAAMRGGVDALAAAVPRPDGPGAFEIVVGKEHYLGVTGRLDPSAPGAPQYLLLSSHEQTRQALRSVQRLIVGAGLAGLVISSLIVSLAVGRITNPLRELQAGADAVGRGDFSRRVDIRRRDELGELGLAFNRMTDGLRESRGQLEETVRTLESTREQLVQSEKLSAIGEFISGIAHELNNPLTAIIGYSQLMGEVELDEHLRRDVQHIGDAAARCHKIVQNLLSFARQRPSERKPVQVNELLDSTVNFMAYELRTSNVEIARDYDPRLPKVLADAYQLQQVFLNIVNNARQAIEDLRRPGSIRLVTTSSGSAVQVELRDNGPGIPPAILGRIFDPFFTTKEAGRGTGLGLSVSYGILRDHGGEIRVQSQVGQGTSFFITLPAASPDAMKAGAGGPAPEEPPLQGNGRTVLVLDDEQPVLDLVGEVLQNAGFKVTALRDAAAGLEQARTRRFDLILCDWKMPGMSGRQFFEQLREATPAAAARVVFMTGDVLGAATQDYLRECGKTCLSKPFTLQQLRAVIRREMR